MLNIRLSLTLAFVFVCQFGFYHAAPPHDIPESSNRVGKRLLQGDSSNEVRASRPRLYDTQDFSFPAISDVEDSDSSDDDESGADTDSWWWEFIHDRLPSFSPQKDFDTLFMYKKSISLNYQIASQILAFGKLPVELKCKPEMILKVEFDNLDAPYYSTDENGQIVENPRERVYGLIAMDDANRRNDPSVTPADFNVMRHFHDYYQKKAQIEKQLIYKGLHWIKPPGELKKTVVNSHRLYVSNGQGKEIAFALTQETNEFCQNYQEYLRYFVVKITPASADIEVYAKVMRLANVARQGGHVTNELMENLRIRLNEELKQEHSFDLQSSTEEGLNPGPGFNVALRPYQKSSLRWLVNLERNAKNRCIQENCHWFKNAARNINQNYLKLGSFGAFIDLNRNQVVDRKPAEVFNHQFACNGAILADEPGTGKTITALALIHTNPAPPPSDNLEFYQGRLKSRATLIIIPGQMNDYWGKTHIKNSFSHPPKVINLFNIIRHRKTSWKDFLDADIVLMPLRFLQNSNYMRAVMETSYKYFQEYKPTLKEMLSKFESIANDELANQKGETILGLIHWRRVIVDEIHEYGNNKDLEKAFESYNQALSADFFLGLTATPQHRSVFDIRNLAQLLKTKLEDGQVWPLGSERTGVCLKFLKYHVRRNSPELNLPPLLKEFVYLDLTPQERLLLDTLNIKTKLNQIMAINHFNLAPEMNNLVGHNEEMTPDQVADTVQRVRENEIISIREEISGIESQLDELSEVDDEEDLDGEANDAREAKRRYLTNRLRRKRSEATEKTNELNRFVAVLDSIRQGEENKICVNCENEKPDLLMSHCSHMFCGDCRNELFGPAPNPSTTSNCPVCEKCIRPDSMYRVSNQKHYSKYGSKLGKFIVYMNDLRQKNPGVKVILFVQFKKLIRMVSKALKQYEIKHVTVDGNVAVRNKAIRQFKTNPAVNLILLSSEDSASGLHLVEATHVIILHPFIFDGDNNNERALHYEKQGISRAWRGGVNHPVTVVRFIVRDTLEEELAQQRGYDKDEPNNEEGPVQIDNNNNSSDNNSESLSDDENE